MASDSELHRWIAESKQTRHRIGIGVAVLAALGFLVMLFDGTLGLGLVALSAIVAAAGFWIVSSHIADWEAQLRRRRRAS
jgi:hypothetical protein